MSKFLAELLICAILNKIPERWAADYCGEIDFSPVHHFDFINAPFPMNAHFTGRIAEMGTLKKGFYTDRPAQSTQTIQTITGMSGCGKTQLALQYAYNEAGRYSVITWIDASSAISIRNSMETVLSALHIKYENVLPSFIEWANHEIGWLIIYDNFSGDFDLNKYLPSNNKTGDIIITTTDKFTSEYSSTINLDVFSPDEATDFLKWRTNSIYDHDASALAKRLGYYPLALEAAGAFLTKHDNETMLSYIKLIDQVHLSVLDQKPAANFYKNTTRKTLKIALSKVSNGDSIDLLKMLALFTDSGMDLKWIKYCLENPKVLSRFEDADVPVFLKRELSAIEFYDLISPLEKYSIVSHKNAMHRAGYDQFRNIRIITTHSLIRELMLEGINADSKIFQIMLEVFDNAAINQPFRDYDEIANFLLMGIKNISSGASEDILNKFSIMAVASLYIVSYPEDAQMDINLIKEILSGLIRVFGEDDIRVAYITALCFAKYGYELYEDFVPFIERAYLSILEKSSEYLAYAEEVARTFPSSTMEFCKIKDLCECMYLSMAFFICHKDKARTEKYRILFSKICDTYMSLTDDQEDKKELKLEKAIMDSLSQKYYAGYIEEFYPWHIAKSENNGIDWEKELTEF